MSVKRSCQYLAALLLCLSAADHASAYYAPHLGRWVSRDPIAYEGSQWSLYEYGTSRPLTTVDPEGLQFGMLICPPGTHPGSCFGPCCVPNEPPQQPRPRPGTGDGFQLCQRDIDEGSIFDKIINACGGEHTYIQHGPCDDDGQKCEGTRGWGFGGGGAGRPPSNEKKFRPNRSWPLKPRPAGTLPDGTPCSQATDEQIADCIANKLTTRAYFYPSYTCVEWADEAIEACCLEK